jgi:hypothetical protein
MEKFDILRTSFQAKNMIPEAGDELTLLWGRKIVENTINGYGMIGTYRCDGPDMVWINLGLSRIYQYPPEIYILWKANDSDSLVHNDSSLYRDSATGYNEYWKRITYFLSNDLLGLRAFIGSSDYVDVFFKIHGV